jgi:hypothetical protein
MTLGACVLVPVVLRRQFRVRGDLAEPAAAVSLTTAGSNVRHGSRKPLTVSRQSAMKQWPAHQQRPKWICLVLHELVTVRPAADNIVARPSRQLHPSRNRRE